VSYHDCDCNGVVKSGPLLRAVLLTTLEQSKRVLAQWQPSSHLCPQMEMQCTQKVDQGYVQNLQNATNGEHWLCSTAPLNNRSKHNTWPNWLHFSYFMSKHNYVLQLTYLVSTLAGCKRNSLASYKSSNCLLPLLPES